MSHERAVPVKPGNVQQAGARCGRQVRGGRVRRHVSPQRRTNVLRRGDVARPSASDADTQAIRSFNERLRDDERVVISLLPMRDGLTLAWKKR